MSQFSIRSESELQGVHPKLVDVVRRALAISAQDFAVQDGLRTLTEQQALVAKGASKTLASKHLAQADGYGHAVDLVPVIDGKLRWEWAPIYVIAQAMLKAAKEFGLKLRWGGVWDRSLNELPETGLEQAVKDYCVRHPGPDFLDGPHFEIAL